METKDALAEKIAGEITLSPKPGLTMRKWRNIFSISQTDLAKFLNLSPSVISDYESGRRKSPGIRTVKKVIDAFISIDNKRGGSVIHQYDPIVKTHDGIIEIQEYPYAIQAEKFIKAIEGNIVSRSKRGLKKKVKGFTLVDSIKTIENITPVNYAHLYGWSPDGRTEPADCESPRSRSDLEAAGRSSFRQISMAVSSPICPGTDHTEKPPASRTGFSDSIPFSTSATLSCIG
ncbi:MAG: helix-turn-helix domain-containing protein [Thermoplasmatota archaeon]